MELFGKSIPDPAFDFDAFIDSEDVRRFVGKNCDHYRKIWAIDYIKANRNINRMVRLHWNWLAILLLPAWLGYRRMFWAFLGWLALISALTFAETWSEGSAAVSYTGINLVGALLSKSLYFQRTLSFYRDSRTLDRRAVDAMIADKGGVSASSAILYTAGGFIVILCAGWLAEALSVPVVAADYDPARVPV